MPDEVDEMVADAPRARNSAGRTPPMERRNRLREVVYGDSDTVDSAIWHKREKGFCTIPRVLPLIATLIRHLAGGVDAGRIYMDLWARQYEDGFVEIIDEPEFAAACGYPNGARGVRSWREGMRALQTLGFIRMSPKGSREFGYVLLLHPDDIVAMLVATDGKRIPSWWLELYRRRVIEVGAQSKS